MNWFKRLFSQTSTRRITDRDPLIVQTPKIAFLNLTGSRTASLVEADKMAFSDLFTLVEDQGTDVPDCDLLMIYCEIGSDGKVAGDSRTLRELIDIAAPSIAIVASENGGDGYIEAGRRNGHPPVNLVMTLDRKGDSFTHFFGVLFRRMFNGQSMLSAWVELAPQSAGVKHEDCPETIFAAEVSHIVFRRD